MILGTSGSNVIVHNGDALSKITYSNINLVPPDSPTILYSTIKLTHCELPYSFYGIDETNNRITINGSTIEVPEGFYTAYTLRDFLNASNALSPTLFTLNTSTGRFSMEYSAPFTVTGTILPPMGLQAGTYNGIWNGSAYMVSFQYAVNLIRTRCLYITFPNLVLDGMDTRNNSSSCLKSIQVNQPPFSIINYQNNESSETLLHNASVANLELEIRGDDGELINFQGQAWTIALEVKTTMQMAKVYGSSFSPPVQPPNPANLENANP